jgi:hypothetical protein
MVTFRSIGVLALALLACSPARGAQAGKEPLTHEALWLMKRVGAPSASPDGTCVVFSAAGRRAA